MLGVLRVGEVWHLADCAPDDCQVWVHVIARESAGEHCDGHRPRGLGVAVFGVLQAPRQPGEAGADGCITASGLLCYILDGDGVCFLCGTEVQQRKSGGIGLRSQASQRWLVPGRAWRDYLCSGLVGPPADCELFNIGYGEEPAEYTTSCPSPSR